MTSYHGGKQRIGKALAEVIYDVATEVADEDDFEIKGYCEPFCGMLGVYQHIPELFEDHRPKLKYKAGDTNASVIKMWKAAQKGWKPPTTCSEEQYDRLKASKATSALKGFVGHQCSFGGIFFGGFGGRYGKSTSIGTSANKVKRIASEVSRVSFTHGSYTQFSKLKGFIIYCDPPYSGTQCRYGDRFDTDNFWDWCEKMSENNLVFISEYSRPPGNTVEVYRSKSKPTKAFGVRNTGGEKMFMYE